MDQDTEETIAASTSAAIRQYNHDIVQRYRNSTNHKLVGGLLYPVGSSKPRIISLPAPTFPDDNTDVTAEADDV
ncbi:hypothetical protein C8Q76DRAFT_789968 [Earliella scabrosa]|nr:hypothetical protein C8Q76DRAFT_789968 [Earliella scabrosa]